METRTISILFDAIDDDSNELRLGSTLRHNHRTRKHGGLIVRRQAYVIAPLFGLFPSRARLFPATKLGRPGRNKLALPRGILTPLKSGTQLFMRRTEFWPKHHTIGVQKTLKWPRPSRSSLIYVSRLHQRHPPSKCWDAGR